MSDVRLAQRVFRNPNELAVIDLSDPSFAVSLLGQF